MKHILILLATLFLAACAGGTHLIVGKIRPAINVNAVKIYTKPPSVSYETIATMKSSSRAGFSEQYRQQVSIDEMKDRAASFGANGLIIDSSDAEIFIIGTSAVTVKATAIYVP